MGHISAGHEGKGERAGAGGPLARVGVDMEALRTAVVEGQRAVAVEGARTALGQGVPARDILETALVPAMATVGDLFRQRQYYVPEMLMAARAMKAAMEVLRPELVAAKVEPLARVVGATVQGDLHDIGKNLVLMMLEGAGFEIVDLGVDCSPERVVTAVREHGARLVCLSALLTTTMPAMREIIAALQENGLRGQVGVLVGGAPMTQAYADEIGADGFAPDAATAVDKAKEVLGKLPAA